MAPPNVLTFGSIELSPTSFNCEVASEYDFRVEPIQDGKFPTVRRFRLWYRDIGVVTFTGTVYGFYEDGTYDNQTLSYGGVSPITIGTVGASGTMKQVNLDMTKTMLCPQLKLTLVASAGPLAIIRLTGVGALRELETL